MTQEEIREEQIKNAFKHIGNAPELKGFLIYLDQALAEVAKDMIQCASSDGLRIAQGKARMLEDIIEKFKATKD